MNKKLTIVILSTSSGVALKTPSSVVDSSIRFTRFSVSLEVNSSECIAEVVSMTTALIVATEGFAFSCTRNTHRRALT